ncbi:MAG: DUF2203 family protein [Planctomycetota bacterium]|nr:DUF2203 family protein [Planctomycetota bacterium]
MKHRILDEARLAAMEPLLRPIVADLIEAYDDVLAAAGRGDGSMDRELEVVQRYVFELEGLGASVRSLEPLAIEFLAEQEGEIGYYPWSVTTGALAAFRSLEALCAVAA